MFGVDFSELALVFVVALLVLGPTRLPGLVRKVGLWVGKARSMARQFREQLESEVNLEELNRMTDVRSKAAQPDYPPPPPGFGGEPMPEAAPEASAAEAAPAEPGTTPAAPEAAPEPEYNVPPPGDASHNDLSEPEVPHERAG